MSKFANSILLLSLSFSLACGDEDKDTASEPSDETAEASDESEPSDETAEASDESEPSDETTDPVVHTVTTAGMSFDPADLVISVGDTVRFEMNANHNAIEVSQATFDAGEATPLEGGFQVDYSETLEVTFDAAGVHYYVCQPHVTLDMVGTITVE